MSDILDRTKQILADLVAFPSISADGNRAVTEHIAALLDAAGVSYWLEPDATGTKLNLFATIGPYAPGGVILSGHTDVVPVEGQPWTSDPFAMIERDGRLYGRGTCDMKGFVAACLAMAPEFAARDLKVPVHLRLFRIHNPLHRVGGAWVPARTWGECRGIRGDLGEKTGCPP